MKTPLSHQYAYPATILSELLDSGGSHLFFISTPTQIKEELSDLLSLPYKIFMENCFPYNLKSVPEDFLYDNPDILISA
ncbi:MAG: hypothetical protein R3D71_07555 [Rickettsiales bacterium]